MMNDQNTALAQELEVALKLLDNVTATDSTADDLGCAELAIGRALDALRTPAPAPVGYSATMGALPVNALRAQSRVSLGQRVLCR